MYFIRLSPEFALQLFVERRSSESTPGKDFITRHHSWALGSLGCRRHSPAIKICTDAAKPQWVLPIGRNCRERRKSLLPHGFRKRSYLPASLCRS
jgi:hypothetical protein